MTPEPIRIGLIGAGRRIKGNYLPALFLLPDHFKVTWVHARRPEPLREAIAPWSVEPLDQIDEEALAGVDAVAISVPTAQNAAVLQQLQQAKQRLHVFIDTPIVTSLKQARALMPLLRGFKGVTVTEDFMNFPEWHLVREIVGEGAIGPVSDVVLDGGGYYYHGLALIRSLFDFDPVIATTMQRSGGDHTVNRFAFSRGRAGTIAYPYRRFDGTVTIVGKRRTISTFPGADTARPVIALERLRGADGLIDALRLTGDGFERTRPLTEVAKLAGMPDHDRSDLNLMRTLGLRAVFASLRDADINRHYGLMAGLYDSITARRANGKARTVDPLAMIGRGTLVERLLK